MPHGPIVGAPPKLERMAADANVARIAGVHEDARAVARCLGSDTALSGSHTPDLTQRRHVDFARVYGQACSTSAR